MNSAPFTFDAQWTHSGTRLNHSWRPIVNIDQFRWLSRADVLAQLRQAKAELGCQHVRAVAMYSPEMRVWGYDLTEWRLPADQKSPVANWQMVDLTLEALLEIGLKPIYTTCFVPEGMSEDPTRCWPDRNPTGMPRSLDQWSEFVADGLRHHIERFGRDEVRSWYFECWNEPNLRGCFFGGSRDEFFRLWSATWRAIKSVDPELRFGGPSTARGEWMPEFLDFTAHDGTPPDYLVTHVYNNDSETNPVSPFDGPASHHVKDSPHFATGIIRGLRQELDRRGWQGEVHWNEWGRSWFPVDSNRESPLEAAFIVKTMTEASQAADAFAFWCLSDIYDQMGFQRSEFAGHYGMLSLHGLRKPAWFAHELLNRMGDRAVPVTGGDDLTTCLATRSEDAAKLLISAYPAAIGDSPVPVEVKVEIPPETKSVRLFRIGIAENNILNTWHRMGSPASPNAAQLAELRAENHLQESVGAVTQEGPAAHFKLERPGVALLECELR